MKTPVKLIEKELRDGQDGFMSSLEEVMRVYRECQERSESGNVLWLTNVCFDFINKKGNAEICNFHSGAGQYKDKKASLIALRMWVSIQRILEGILGEEELDKLNDAFNEALDKALGE